MVSPQKHHIFGVIYFEGHNEGHNFDRVGAPVHIVAQKKQFGSQLLIDISDEGKNLHKVIILTMDIPNDDNRSVHF